MTEYELLDYTAAVMGNFQTALALYFTIVTAYVVAAFVAGARLTRLQLYVINTCFVIAAGVVGFLTVAIWNRFFSFAMRTRAYEGAGATVDFTWPLAMLVAIVFVGCFVFMWSIRSQAK